MYYTKVHKDVNPLYRRTYIWNFSCVISMYNRRRTLSLYSFRVYPLTLPCFNIRVSKSYTSAVFTINVIAGPSGTDPFPQTLWRIQCIDFQSIYKRCNVMQINLQGSNMSDIALNVTMYCVKNSMVSDGSEHESVIIWLYGIKYPMICRIAKPTTTYLCRTRQPQVRMHEVFAQALENVLPIIPTLLEVITKIVKHTSRS